MEGVSIYITLDDRRAKKTGKFPVKLMLIYKMKPYRVNVGIDLTKEDWEKTQSNRPGKKLEETKIKLDQILDKGRRVLSKMRSFSIDRFKQLYNADQPKTLLLDSLFDAYIYVLRSKDKLSSAESYTSAKKALLSFNKETFGNEFIELLEIDPRWLEQFEAWWLHQGKSITTAGIYLRNLRSIFNRAIDDGVISRDYYPFGVKKFEIPEGRNIKKALRREHIDQIKAYETTTEAEEKAKDLFLFSYYCFGMNMKDIALLRYRQINEDGITFVREKTKSTKRRSIQKTFVSINSEMQRIIKKHGSDPITPEAFIFGIVEQSDTVGVQKKKIDQLTKTTNKYMKRIGKALEFDLTLTTYVARHSAISILHNNGASTQFIMDKVAHSSEKSTEKYVDSLDDGKTAKWQSIL